MNNVVLEEHKMRMFPSLLAGSKATTVLSEIRACATWSEMKKKFVDLCKVDKNALRAQLKALRVENYDVQVYINKFTAALKGYDI